MLLLGPAYFIPGGIIAQLVRADDLAMILTYFALPLVRVGLFQRALTDPTMKGAYIASSPNPVSQAEFMRTMRRSLGVRVGLPTTATMVRIGAPLVMRTDPELALYGRYVVSERLRAEGFVFRSPELRDALADLAG